MTQGPIPLSHIFSKQLSLLYKCQHYLLYPRSPVDISVPQPKLCSKPDQLDILLAHLHGGVNQPLSQVGGHNAVIIRVKNQGRCLDLWKIFFCQELDTSGGENLTNILQ